jgi:preprotein translocase subunit SecF
MKPERMALVALLVSALLGLSLALAGVPRSIEFTGGSMIRIRGENLPDPQAVESLMERTLGADVWVDLVRGGLDLKTQLELTEDQKTTVKDLLSSEFGIREGSVNIDALGANIIAVYAGQAVIAVAGAFVAMAVIIMITFRRKVPVGAMLLAVGLDMLDVFGLMSIFRVELSLASLAGILMLIGYSVDTNILLTTSLLRRTEGEPLDRLSYAMGTGLMMTGTTMVPLVALNVLTSAPQLYQLTMVLMFGMLSDIMNTWMLNAGILLRYHEKSRKVKYHVAL